MPRRGENIYKRKDGRWEARYIKQRSPEGRTVYGYLYARTYREVKAKLQQHKGFSKSESIASTCMVSYYNQKTFQTIAESWLSSIMPQVKVSTVNKYRNLLVSYIYPRFGTKVLTHVTHDFIEAECNELLQIGGQKGTGLSPKTVADILSVIRSVLKFAIKAGECVPCDGKSIQIKQSAKEMRVLSRNEQKQLCNCLYSDLSEYNIGILVSLFTRLRVGEICALRWEDISITDQTIHVRQTMQRIQDKSSGQAKTKVIITAPKSPCSIRTIPIPDDLFRVIVSHKSTTAGFFLTNSTQRFIEPRTMQNRFKYALRTSGVSNANFHALRHTFATRCVELGFDVKSLSEILGHASVNITMNRYVHPSMELKKENMQKLSELFAVK